MQGLFVPFACVGSGDPVRVLRLLHNKYTGFNWGIYCWDNVQLVATKSNVLLYSLPTSVQLCCWRASLRMSIVLYCRHFVNLLSLIFHMNSTRILWKCCPSSKIDQWSVISCSFTSKLLSSFTLITNRLFSTMWV